MKKPDGEFFDKEVRLFPTAHISSEREAELRATAALLCVIRAVSEFGRKVVKLCGGPAGSARCYAEVSFKLSRKGKAPRDLRPDALVVVQRGKTKWSALVETKVGDAVLDSQQLHRYLQLAKQENIDAVITVSNQSATAGALPPVRLGGRRLKKPVRAIHFSWARLLSEARVLLRNARVQDTDQEWILCEWVKYLGDAQSKIITQPTLSSHWAAFVRAARARSLGHSQGEMDAVCEAWVAYLPKLVFRLRAKLGVDADQVLSRAHKKEPAVRLKDLGDCVARGGPLEGVIRIPNTVGDISISLDPAVQVVRYSLDIDAPREGYQATRLNWLSRQLRSLSFPKNADIVASWETRGLKTLSPLVAFLEDPHALARSSENIALPKEVQPRSFTIKWSEDIPKCRGKNSGPVLASISEGVERFYRDLVEHLRPHTPRAPRMVSTDGDDSRKERRNAGEPPEESKSD